mgnify:CR=1 FL=1
MIKETFDRQSLTSLGEYLEYVPYDVNPRQLYNAEMLYQGIDLKDESSVSNTFDAYVYQHFTKTGKRSFSTMESLARCLHDNGMQNSLFDFLSHFKPTANIGIMGGHGLLRTDPMFREIVMISKTLTEKGFLMVSGGGPGSMEATHLGAWLAGYSDADVSSVLHRLSIAPCFRDSGWLKSALLVMRDYPQTRYVSLGIPTWLYGHEPSTPFATHIAKFFDNSIREDVILTFAFGGIIYTPGSAGTMQEIFQDAVQNHYLSYEIASPMVFLGSQFWTEEMPIYPLLKHLSETGRYKNLLLTLTDSKDEVVQTLLNFKPSL